MVGLTAVARGGVPLAHQHVRDPLGRRVRHRGPLLVARRARAAIAGGGGAARRGRRGRLAVVVYYAHFLETYRTELARIGGETAAAAPDAGGRGIGDRLARCRATCNSYFGVPALALAAWGVALLVARGARDRTTLAIAGWVLTCGLFLVLGILTPVDMRYYLAAIPALALVAAIGSSIAWTSGGPSRIAAAGLLAGRSSSQPVRGGATIG